MDSSLLAVGSLCSLDSCNLVDFLPFKCQHCSQKFCAEHYLVAAHNCSQYDASKADRIAPNCPVCSTPVAIPPGEDANVRMDLHLQTCPTWTGKPLTKSGPVCAKKRCGKSLISPIRCNTCRKDYCAQHRFPNDHECKLDGNTLSSSSSPVDSSASTSSVNDLRMARFNNLPRTKNVSQKPSVPKASKSSASLGTRKPASINSASLPNPKPVESSGSPNSAQNKTLSTLQSIFPSFDITALRSVLESVGGDQDRAVDLLLAM